MQHERASRETKHPSAISTARTFVYAVAMAIALIPIASIPAHATTLTCGFGENAAGACGGTASDRTFDFGPYSVELDFSGLTGSFDIAMTDVPTNQSDYVSETQDRFANLPGYQCVAIVDPAGSPSDPCREFDVATDPATAAGQTYSNYVITIRWLYNSEPLFPDDGGRIRLLHDSSQNQDNQFADITIPGSYEPFNAVVPLVADPGIGGFDDNFQSFVVAQAPAVPEPATLVLLGTGIGGFVCRRRRRGRA